MAAAAAQAERRRTSARLEGQSRSDGQSLGPWSLRLTLSHRAGARPRQGPLGRRGSGTGGVTDAAACRPLSLGRLRRAGLGRAAPTATVAGRAAGPGGDRDDSEPTGRGAESEPSQAEPPPASGTLRYMIS